MPRFAQVQGLEAFEAGSDSARRYHLPLTHEGARQARAALEQHAELTRELLFPSAALEALRAVEGLVLRGPKVVARLVVGGELASLRRILVIETSTDLTTALEQIGLGEFVRAPSEEEEHRHQRAMSLLREDPKRVARWWVDGDRWPPDEHELSGPAPPSDLASRLVADGTLLSLEVLVRTAEATSDILKAGLIPARWRLLAGGELDGLSPERDLRSGGASFVFARMLTRDRIDHPLPDGLDYSVLLDPKLLDTQDRFVLREERFGSLHSISEARSDREVEVDLRAGRWPAHHEILFLRALPPGGVIGVQCRSPTAETRLRALTGPGGPPTWVGPTRSWPSGYGSRVVKP